MPELPQEGVAALDRLIVKSPYGALLGLELLDAEEGRARVRMPYRGELTTLGDTVHGGAIAALVDTAATASFWASASVAPGSRGTTIGFSLNFVAAARGKDLVATAAVRRRGREISTGEVAVALVTYKLSPPA